MDFCELIESYREELPHFNAHDYPVSFCRFKEQAAPLFDALETPEMEASLLVDELVKRCDHLSRRVKKEVLHQDKLVLSLYFSPAADRHGGTAMVFAAEVNRLWNASFPRNRFLLGRYEDIMRGFEASILGIPLKNYERR